MQTLDERFWSKVAKSEGCWEWTASLFSTGYGAFRVGNKQMKASRVSWFIANGSWPDGMVCHTCDNPKCVRPDHLFVGTGDDNVADRNRKGRTAKGSSHGMTKATPEIRAAVRSEYVLKSATSGITALAKKYRLGKSTIWRIVSAT